MARRAIALMAVGLMLHLNMAAAAALAQQAAPAAQATPAGQEAQTFDAPQLDALLAPIALYPDELLTQILIAVTFPLQIVQAKRWLDDPAHKSLTGKALTDALNAQSWDPSVKSLVPFPQVIDQLNGNLDWMQQVGFAVVQQQKDVLDAVQRLRRQAQGQGHLQSSPQQVVREDPQPSGPPAVIIEPAQPDVVYVPSYDPAAVYGSWPYPSYPPTTWPPAPGYVAGTALVSGLAFGAGVAITAGLWGWASPNWGHGDVNVNVNRWNSINANRQQIHSNVWNAANRPGGRPVMRAPAGPVGRPVHGNGVAPNAIGRASVKLPANAVNRPVRENPAARSSGQRPNLAPGSRPNPPAARPNVAANRPNVAANRPNIQANHPNFQARPQGGAFGGLNEGNRAQQFQQRGSQSREFQHHAGGFQRPSGGPQRPAGGGFQRGGGGGHRGGGGGGRR